MGQLILPQWGHRQPVISQAQPTGEWVAIALPTAEGVIDLLGLATATPQPYVGELGHTMVCGNSGGGSVDSYGFRFEASKLYLASDFTVLVSFAKKALFGNNPGIFRTGSTALGVHFCILQGATLRPWIRVGGTDVLKPASGPAFDGDNMTIAFRFVGGQFADCWWGGEQQHYATTAKTYSYSAAEYLRYIGFQAGVNESVGDINLFALAHRALSDGELGALTRNPWQLFKPKSIIVPVTTGGGGGISQAFFAAVETNTGLQLAHTKSKAFTTSAETSSAQQLTSAKSLTFLAGNEADFAQALTPSKSQAFGQSSEIDSAEAFVQAGATPLAQTSETSTAHAFAKAKVKALGQAVDGQAALALIAQHSKALTQAAETSAAQAVSKAKVKAFSTAQETDNAQSLGLAGPKFIALGQVGESDTALPISREGAGQLPTGGGGGGRVGGAARVRSTRKLNELFEEIFTPTATVEQAVEKVEAAFKDKPNLEEVVAVIEEAERKAAVTATETAVRRAKAVAKRLENLRRELEAEEEAVVTLLLL